MRPWYSSINEDYRTERRALQIGADDEVLCITGSGARPLDLLIEDPRHLVAVDHDASQSALLELKVAALRELTFAEYRVVLGLEPASPGERRALLERLGPTALCAEDLAAHGVLYVGRWERYYARLSRLVRLIRGSLIDALFDCDSIEAQRALVRERWDSWTWRCVFGAVCSPTVSRWCFGDAAYYRHVAVPVGRTLHTRMLRALDRSLAKDNFMLSLVFRARLSESDLPPHLTEAGFVALRSRLDRLEIRTARVEDALAAESGRYTRVSFSDAPSFLDAGAFNALCVCLAENATPGARFCVRQFLTRYTMPATLARQLRREPELEQALALEDHAFAYEFLVGTVVR